MKSTKWHIGHCAGFALGVAGAMASWAQAIVPGPLIDPSKITKISDHVYVIPDESRQYIPNVGIVVGQRAVLVIDAGMGLRNGEIVLAEARKHSAGKQLYIVATHHHPEHDTGAAAFPANATMIRSRVQQRDVDEVGMAQADIFAKRAPELAALLAGARDRRADVLFDDEYRLELGGVTVQMHASGPAHTRGDTIFYIEQDRVLFAGDVAQRRVPLLRSPAPSVAGWLKVLPKLKQLNYRILVPSHGRLGDASTVETTEQYLKTVQSRTRELKTQGMTVEQITAQLTKELAPRFSDWQNISETTIGEAVRPAFAEAQ